MLRVCLSEGWFLYDTCLGVMEDLGEVERVVFWSRDSNKYESESAQEMCDIEIS